MEGVALLKHHRTAGLLAGFLCLALAAPAAAQDNVTVRVEGANGTLLEETPVRTFAGVVRDKEECKGTDIAGALDVATGGSWDGNYFDSFGYSVETILGETYRFSDNRDFWAVWRNNAATSGICKEPVQEGDEVLFWIDRCVYSSEQMKCTNDPVYPLGLTAPATGRTDAPSEVTVVRYAPDGTSTPVEGARVTGSGVDATTGSAGKASVAFGQSGQIRLKASKEGYARSAAETVAVSAPGAAAVTPPVATVDKTAPAAKVTGIRSGRRYSRKRAPRTLSGSVTPDPSGLRAVKLSLTRSHGGRCQIYSPTRERFRNARCGRRVNFSIGDREDWSYLLPKRLGTGRYVLDVIAVDKQGNRDSLARGRNRVVFFVR